MPCYRCGARQVDPVRGHSPWRRGVKDDELVLVCPGCQASADWTADLDKCRQCGSVHLVRRLGEVECRDCGMTVPPDSSLAAGAHTRTCSSLLTPRRHGLCPRTGSTCRAPQR